MNNIKNKSTKKIPSFKNEEEEIKFWDKHDTTDYFDYDNPIKLDLSNLKPSTEKVTLRMTEWMLDDIKMLANRHDVPYQSMMKILLAEKLEDITSSQHQTSIKQP